jgi:carboxymethylenebutenolidase
MCDDITVHSNEEYFAKKSGVGEMSRRGFTAFSAAAFAASCAAPKGGAKEVVEQEVTIKTPDGEADAHFAAPSSGRHAAVLVWPDIMGLRGSFRAMGKRLAENGYAVLTVNPFYRKAKGEVFHPGEAFSDPAVRGRLMPLAQSLTPDTQKTDATAFIAWLDQQKQVNTRRGVGTTGYCMGGPIVMRTCAYVPNRVKAGASFHGGGLLTAQPTSPHLLIPQMKSSMLIAVAQNDDAQDVTVKDKLKAAFAASNVPAEIEVYPAQHGWCPPDSAVYDATQAERAWSRLLALFETSLA